MRNVSTMKKLPCHLFKGNCLICPMNYNVSVQGQTYYLGIVILLSKTNVDDSEGGLTLMHLTL